MSGPGFAVIGTVYNRGGLITRARGVLALSLAGAGILVWMAASPAGKREAGRPPRLSVSPAGLFADGYDTATLEIAGSPAGQPAISVSENPHAVTIEDITGGGGKWQAHLRAGVLGGRVRVRVQFPGAAPAEATLSLALDTRDTAGDGTPDFLRLDDPHDRQSFRRWFAFLGEAQYFQAPASRPPEIDDCAALIRYAYREALRAHDSAWAATARLPLVPAYDSVAKYQYPYTPLGASLFRVREGGFEPADLANGAFAQFADAQTLRRYNTRFRSRDLGAAEPGDLLFYRQAGAREPFHGMIYLGESLIHPDGKRYILYHTGPNGSDPGEMRRLTVEVLLNFPQPRWRPVAGNPSFLGVSRWNILKEGLQ
jgi:uncharacterized protein YfaT (DUF1175 family)